MGVVVLAQFCQIDRSFVEASMAKLKNKVVDQSDLTEYLEKYSDFSFEVSVLKALDRLGFTCEHSGSYTDRTTQKIREFDIRALKIFEKSFLRLAVECKNLRENYPLIVSCIPRGEKESFHDIIASVDPEVQLLEEPEQFSSRAMALESKAIRVPATHSFYRMGSPVGKSCDQVGRGYSDEIISGDSDVYSKWSQALSSADDLIYDATRDGIERTGDIAFGLVIPLLVVPNGRLWTAEFNDVGTRVSSPIQVDRCSYFVNLNYTHRSNLFQTEVCLSHLEFVTENGLVTFINEHFGSDEIVRDTFAIEFLVEEITKQFDS
ncbi:MAG: hypothetical protein C0478_06725 [Planctomyces sp.]|nr:hypothetical protein [Planctomyces sp.]